VPPALQRELDEFVKWRTLIVNSERNGVCVEAITAAGNRSDALRLLGWLKTERNVAAGLCALFGSGRLGPGPSRLRAVCQAGGDNVRKDHASVHVSVKKFPFYVNRYVKSSFF